ncbi:acyl-CoA desaturase [Rhodopila sp.]|uniref:acyl-CoA desaturase n=1 Tax=Rhodopila sp. TaxID=2480087 RepID=UPI003D0ED5F8
MSTPHSTASLQPGTTRLPLPAAVDRHRIVWPYAITVVIYHLLALLALLPGLFSWTGVALAVLGLYVFGTLGINLCFHRLLTHRGLNCPKWLEHGFAVLGVCCMQDTPARWVAVHRRHHEQADRRDDPHSPLVAFFWGHVGWMLVHNRDLVRLGIYDRYAKDILRDPFYRRMERTALYPLIMIGSWAVFFLGGLAIGLAGGDGAARAAQFGASLLIWGVFVRTVVVWHITWSVNSASHLWGYRNYETGEHSRNNWFVALISNGEGWHNNHHADPRSARHGHRRGEIDVTFLTIRVLQSIGLASDVATMDKRTMGAPPIEQPADP